MIRSYVYVREAEPSTPPATFLKEFEPHYRARSEDRSRYQVIVGLDAERHHEVAQLTKWVCGYFGLLARDADRGRFGSTVFVLDQPCAKTGLPGLSREEMNNLVAAGACYRPKASPWYDQRKLSLAEALRRDLIDQKAIPSEEVVELDEPPSAPCSPGKDDPDYADYLRLLKHYANPPLVWPPEVLRELFQGHC